MEVQLKQCELLVHKLDDCYRIMPEAITPITCFAQDASFQSSLFPEYQRQVLDIRLVQPSHNLASFPLISYEQFVKVRTLWHKWEHSRQFPRTRGQIRLPKGQTKGLSAHNPINVDDNRALGGSVPSGSPSAEKEIIKRVKLVNNSEIVLTYQTMHRLSFGQLLNDDLINCYLDLVRRELPPGLKILNTYFACTLDARNKDKNLRMTRRIGLTDQDRVVVPINVHKTHWLFAVLAKGSLLIADSLKHHQFWRSKEVAQVASWATDFFGEHTLQLSQDFPQQENGCDCGMFLLQGVKDIARARPWSFTQLEIPYRRLLASIELLEERLMA